MTQHEGPRSLTERPVGNRRRALASAIPRHPLVATAPSAATDIPDKLYFRIGEVARLCNVKTYVLRFWETEFPQLRPNKGGTGQRLFRRRDVETALRIRHLLYNEGYTIPGARQLLKTEIKPLDSQLALAEDPTTRQLRADRLRTLYRSLCDLYASLSTSPANLRDARPLLPSSTLPRPSATSPARSPRPSRRTSPPPLHSLFAALERDQPAIPPPPAPITTLPALPAKSP